MSVQLEEIAEQMIQSIERKDTRYALRVELAGDQLVLYTRGLMEYLAEVGDTSEAREVFKNRFEQIGMGYTRMHALLLDHFGFLKELKFDRKARFFEPGSKGEALFNVVNDVVESCSQVNLYLIDPKQISELHVLTPEEVEDLDYIEIRQKL